jgi:UPF0148 protein
MVLSAVSNSPDLKKAASMLLRGGTLTNEQCPQCGGIQVRFEGKQTCVVCGYEAKAGEEQAPKEIQKRSTHSKKEKQGDEKGATIIESQSAESLITIIEEKLSEVTSSLRDEKDIESQRRKADLIEKYLRILQLLRSQ